MKTFLVALCFMFTIVVTNAQQVHVGHAYSQLNMPGMRPVDENGNERKILPSYYIFFQCTKKEKIKFEKLWIDGKAHTFDVADVTTNPYTIEIFDGMSNNKTILVPSTKKQVVRLNVDSSPNEAEKPVSKIAALCKANAVVLEYTCGKIKKTCVVKKMQQLKGNMYP